MDIPKNCKECMFASDCKAYYGGSTCKYKEDLYYQYIQSLNKK